VAENDDEKVAVLIQTTKGTRRRLKLLSAETGKTMQALLAEAIALLLEKAEADV
jgi:predicted DNA-binding protein